MLASGSRDGSVKLWDPKDGALIAELAKHTGAVTALSFSNPKEGDKGLLAVATRDADNAGEIKIWQIEKNDKQGWQK